MLPGVTMNESACTQRSRPASPAEGSAEGWKGITAMVTERQALPPLRVEGERVPTAGSSRPTSSRLTRSRPVSAVTEAEPRTQCSRPTSSSRSQKQPMPARQQAGAAKKDTVRSLAIPNEVPVSPPSLAASAGQLLEAVRQQESASHRQPILRMKTHAAGTPPMDADALLVFSPRRVGRQDAQHVLVPPSVLSPPRSTPPKDSVTAASPSGGSTTSSSGATTPSWMHRVPMPDAPTTPQQSSPASSLSTRLSTRSLPFASPSRVTATKKQVHSEEGRHGTRAHLSRPLAKGGGKGMQRLGVTTEADDQKKEENADTVLPASLAEHAASILAQQQGMEEKEGFEKARPTATCFEAPARYVSTFPFAGLSGTPPTAHSAVSTRTKFPNGSLSNAGATASSRNVEVPPHPAATLTSSLKAARRTVAKYHSPLLSHASSSSEAPDFHASTAEVPLVRLTSASSLFLTAVEEGLVPFPRDTGMKEMADASALMSPSQELQQSGPTMGSPRSGMDRAGTQGASLPEDPEALWAYYEAKADAEVAAGSRSTKAGAPSLLSITLPPLVCGEETDGRLHLGLTDPDRLPCGFKSFELFLRILDRESDNVRDRLTGLDVTRFMRSTPIAGRFAVLFFWFVVVRCRRVVEEKLLVGRYEKLLASYQELFPRGGRQESLPRIDDATILATELRHCRVMYDRLIATEQGSEGDLSCGDVTCGSAQHTRTSLTYPAGISAASASVATTMMPAASSTTTTVATNAPPASAGQFPSHAHISQSEGQYPHNATGTPRRNRPVETSVQEFVTSQLRLHGFYGMMLKYLASIVATGAGSLPSTSEVESFAQALALFRAARQEYASLVTYEETLYADLALMFGAVCLQLAPHGRGSPSDKKRNEEKEPSLATPAGTLAASSVATTIPEHAAASKSISSVETESSGRDIIMDSFATITVHLAYYTLLYCFPNDAHAGYFQAAFRADLLRLLQYWCSGIILTHIPVRQWPKPTAADRALAEAEKTGAPPNIVFPRDGTDGAAASILTGMPHTSESPESLLLTTPTLTAKPRTTPATGHGLCGPRSSIVSVVSTHVPAHGVPSHGPLDSPPVASVRGDAQGVPPASEDGPLHRDDSFVSAHLSPEDGVSSAGTRARRPRGNPSEKRLSNRRMSPARGGVTKDTPRRVSQRSSPSSPWKASGGTSNAPSAADKTDKEPVRAFVSSSHPRRTGATDPVNVHATGDTVTQTRNRRHYLIEDASDDDFFDNVDVSVANGEFRLISEFHRYTQHATSLVQELKKRTNRQHRRQLRKLDMGRGLPLGRDAKMGGGGRGRRDPSPTQNAGASSPVLGTRPSIARRGSTVPQRHNQTQGATPAVPTTPHGGESTRALLVAEANPKPRDHDLPFGVSAPSDVETNAPSPGAAAVPRMETTQVGVDEVSSPTRGNDSTATAAFIAVTGPVGGADALYPEDPNTLSGAQSDPVPTGDRLDNVTRQDSGMDGRAFTTAPSSRSDLFVRVPSYKSLRSPCGENPFEDGTAAPTSEGNASQLLNFPHMTDENTSPLPATQTKRSSVSWSLMSNPQTSAPTPPPKQTAVPRVLSGGVTTGKSARKTTAAPVEAPSPSVIDLAATASPPFPTEIGKPLTTDAPTEDPQHQKSGNASPSDSSAIVDPPKFRKRLVAAPGSVTGVTLPAVVKPSVPAASVTSPGIVGAALVAMSDGTRHGSESTSMNSSGTRTGARAQAEKSRQREAKLKERRLWIEQARERLGRSPSVATSRSAPSGESAALAKQRRGRSSTVGLLDIREAGKEAVPTNEDHQKPLPSLVDLAESLKQSRLCGNSAKPAQVPSTAVTGAAAIPLLNGASTVSFDCPIASGQASLLTTYPLAECSADARRYLCNNAALRVSVVPIPVTHPAAKVMADLVQRQEALKARRARKAASATRRGASTTSYTRTMQQRTLGMSASWQSTSPSSQRNPNSGSLQGTPRERGTTQADVLPMSTSASPSHEHTNRHDASPLKSTPSLLATADVGVYWGPSRASTATTSVHAATPPRTGTHPGDRSGRTKTDLFARHDANGDADAQSAVGNPLSLSVHDKEDGRNVSSHESTTTVSIVRGPSTTAAAAVASKRVSSDGAATRRKHLADHMADRKALSGHMQRMKLPTASPFMVQYAATELDLNLADRAPSSSGSHAASATRLGRLNSASHSVTSTSVALHTGTALDDGGGLATGTRGGRLTVSNTGPGFSSGGLVPALPSSQALALPGLTDPLPSARGGPVRPTKGVGRSSDLSTRVTILPRECGLPRPRLYGPLKKEALSREASLQKEMKQIVIADALSNQQYVAEHLQHMSEIAVTSSDGATQKFKRQARQRLELQKTLS